MEIMLVEYFFENMTKILDVQKHMFYNCNKFNIGCDTYEKRSYKNGNNSKR